MLLHIFKLVFYFDSTPTSTQIKYYLTTFRLNFLKIQYLWLLEVCFADSLWLVVERQFTKNSRKPGTWLFGSLWWKVIEGLQLDEIVQVSLFSSTGTEIVNTRGWGKDRYLTRSTKYTDTESCHLQSLWKFAKISGRGCIFIWFNK